MRSLFVLLVLTASSVNAQGEPREVAAPRLRNAAATPAAPQSPAARATIRITVTDEGMHTAIAMRERGADKKDLERIRVHQPYKLEISGIAISPSEVVTIALHPRANLRVICTLHDGSVTKATVVGTDPLSNVALLEVPVQLAAHVELSDAPMNNHAAVEMIGHRHEGGRETSGLVTQEHCGVRLVDLYGVNGGQPISLGSTFVVAARTAHLNAGSACVDEQGKLAGILIGAMPQRARQADSPDGQIIFYEQNFVVPATRIAKIVHDLRTHGKVIRAHYGFQMTPVTDALRSHISLPKSASAVVHVESESPASRAGLRRNDVILTVDGKNYRDMYMLGEAMTDKAPGEQVKLQVLRAGKPLTLAIVPSQR